MRKIVGVICTILAAASLLFTAAAQAEPFKLTGSGWANSTELDGNGNGFRISIITTFGTGTFGKSVSNATTETGGVIGLCSLDNEPSIFRLEILARTSVTRFASGALLYTTLATGGQLSSICFDPANQTLAGEIHMEITGGTGLFAGATGTLLRTTNAEVLLSEGGRVVQVAGTVSTEGEIFLNP